MFVITRNHANTHKTSLANIIVKRKPRKERRKKAFPFFFGFLSEILSASEVLCVINMYNKIKGR